jgi:hypothetical protein
MKIPNFDNNDLAVFAVTIIALPVLLVGLFKGIDPAALLGFGGLTITGIIGLAKSKQAEKKVEPKD